VATAFNTSGLSFFSPVGLAFDPSGTLWVSDDVSTIANIDTTTGVVTNFATSGVVLIAPWGLAFEQSASPATAVPELFTIIGTLLGGTAAMRMRKKLK
jgi:secreted PhoX family phosphatase